MPPLPRDMLAEHLYRRFQALSEANRARRAAIRTAQDWSAERERLLAAYKRMLGPFPARNDLSPEVTGRLERERYTIEKVIYRTQPGLLVTANAYVPKHVSGRVPGVLVPCGHSNNGKAAETYQRLCAGLAAKGYFVLIYDPIGQGERQMYWDASLGQSALAGNTTQHSYVGNQYLLAGRSLAGLMVWDSIRSIDYLCSRPEVDASRIGIAGNSGGGTNSAYTAPLDDRISAAAICCYITTLAWRRRVWSTGDAEQDLVGQLEEGLDHADFLRLLAPRPVLVGSAALDYFPLEGARESVAQAQELYETLGVPERIAHAVGEGGHGYSQALRRATYAWLNRWLKVDADDTELDIPVESDVDLQVTPEGQVALLGSEDAFTLLQRSLQSADSPPEGAPDLAARVQRAVRYESPAARPPAREPASSLHRYNGLVRWEQLTVWPEHDVAVPVQVRTWRAFDNPYRALLWLAGSEIDAARLAAVESVLAAQLLPAGWLLATADLRGVGETAPRSNGRRDSMIMGAEAFLAYEALVAGSTLVGMRVRDAACVVDALLARPDVASAHGVSVVGWGSGGLVAMHLGTLSDQVHGVATVDTLTSYRSVASHERYMHSVAGLVPGTVPATGGAGAYDLGDLAIASGAVRVRDVDHLARPLSDETDGDVARRLLAWLNA